MTWVVNGFSVGQISVCNGVLYKLIALFMLFYATQHKNEVIKIMFYA